MLSKKLLSVCLVNTITMFFLTVVTTAMSIYIGTEPLQALILTCGLTVPMWLASLSTFVASALLGREFFFSETDRMKPTVFVAIALFIVLFAVFALVYKQIIYIPILG